MVHKLALGLFSESLTDVTESVIDRIPHPDLRDRLILLRGTFTFFLLSLNSICVEHTFYRSFQPC